MKKLAIAEEQWQHHLDGWKAQFIAYRTTPHDYLKQKQRADENKDKYKKRREALISEYDKQKAKIGFTQRRSMSGKAASDSALLEAELKRKQGYYTYEKTEERKAKEEQEKRSQQQHGKQATSSHGHSSRSSSGQSSRH